ncbi:MAG: hypothetical protein HY062_18740 [Bacteroidetes bacterium]|nr:hypothetical protein [Bacteroidota bacterium]
MNTYYETGHSKNVANLEDLISFCVGYGATYNPSKAAIKVANLNTLLATAKANIAAVNTTLTAFHNATNAREIAFEPLRPLGTKILNALIACGASGQTINDFKTLNRKVQGKRAGSKLTKADAGKVAAPTPSDPLPEPTDTNISAAQLSYDSYMDHYGKIIALLTTEPLYLPNETALKLPALNALMTSLTTTNTAVINATTAYSNARIARNKTLYLAGTGLCDTVKDVKAYVKSVFGATSPEYKQISKIKFTKGR